MRGRTKEVLLHQPALLVLLDIIHPPDKRVALHVAQAHILPEVLLRAPYAVQAHTAPATPAPAVPIAKRDSPLTPMDQAAISVLREHTQPQGLSVYLVEREPTTPTCDSAWMFTVGQPFQCKWLSIT